MSEATALSDGDSGSSPELDVTIDMAKRGLIAAPVWIGFCTLIWGAQGAAGAGYTMAIVIGNFLLSAYLLATTARISTGLMMGAALFGYLMRLGLIFIAVWMVWEESWISPFAIAATIIVTHLGLLLWELRYVSLTLSGPGLKQNPKKSKSTASRQNPTTVPDTTHTDAS